MIDMKRKKRKVTKSEPIEFDGGDYPYYLRITLREEELRKLGFSVKDFDVSETVNFTAKGRVVSLTDSENDKSVEIQVTEIEIAKKVTSKFVKYSQEKKAGPGEVK